MALSKAQICPERLCMSGTVLGAEHKRNRQKNPPAAYMPVGREVINKENSILEADTLYREKQNSKQKRRMPAVEGCNPKSEGLRKTQ